MKPFIIGENHTFEGQCCAWCDKKFVGAFGLGHNDRADVVFPHVCLCTNCGGVCMVESKTRIRRMGQEDYSKLPSEVIDAIEIGRKTLVKVIHDRRKEKAVHN